MIAKVLFLLPYPLHSAPSQRFRVEAYFRLLEKDGITFHAEEFFDQNAWNILYKKGSVLQKVFAVMKGFARRSWFVLLKGGSFEYIFVHREAEPLGPPIFEWWLSKVLRKKIIYDYDDAIWIPNFTEGNQLARSVKCFWKVKWICKWSHKVSAGNEFLAAYGKQYNNNVVVNPTCVDTDDAYNIIPSLNNNPPVIGWTGSHSTIQFLAEGISAIKKLEQQKHFRFLTICDRKPDFNVRSLEFKPWSRQSEIEDLSEIDIGIMPMKNDQWNQGKCGFKLIQYMALGIPAVASPVGVNKKIIDEGVSGYLCNSDEEWVERLSDLLSDPQKRKDFGERGRRKIVNEYSIASNASNFLSLFSN